MLVESAQRDRIILLPLHPDMNDEDINSFKKFADVLRQERFDGTTSARIDRLRLEGKSDNQIARRLGLSRQTVNAHPRLH
jgi:DNA-binding NarL/FixJ family response regulator